jgi:hypothetical protein
LEELTEELLAARTSLADATERATAMAAEHEEESVRLRTEIEELQTQIAAHENRPRLAFPMEFQLTPVRRTTPRKMPWVDELRAASGTSGPLMYVADGEMIEV